MKMMLFLASSLAAASLLVPARAQTAPGTPHTSAAAQASGAKAAARRAEAYQGPKVVPDSKKLGQKMLQNSRPTDAIITRLDELKPRPAVK